MQLPVLNNASSPSGVVGRQREALADDLARLCRGAVRFGRHDRMLYATDASLYQVEPIGVVIPADVEDARRVVEFCSARGVAMLPRGGGTALAGQTTGDAVVIDLSARCRAIGPVRPSEVGGGVASVEVEPGVPIDILNAELVRRGTGLFFAPDPATTAQSAIGGNIGTNAAGSRSIRYGRTSENLLGLDVALAGGERLWLQAGSGRQNATALRLAQQVIAITRRHEAQIRERYPKTLRQNAGFGLDRVLKQLDAGATPETLDLAQLLCGSEGALALTLAARLRLHPIPKGKGLALLAFATLEDAIDAVAPILKTGPSAVELVDDVVIEAARGNRECTRYVDAFPKPGGRDPHAVLYVEYQQLTPAEIEPKFQSLRQLVGAGVEGRFLTDPAAMADAWKLRKAGEPLLHGLPGPRKPLTFVEDNAVPVENLGRFVREFKQIVARAGTRAAFWAHASVGVLHVRPMLNPHDEADMVRLRGIAVEVADLTRACGGVMSGEHGDGRVRGPLLRRFFGDDLMTAFAEVKSAFDPQGLFNPGNIVGAGPIESITERTRIQPQVGELGRASKVEVRTLGAATYYDYADQEDFAHAVEMCNGSGVCRKTTGGTMCPSYRATLDERHSTRGRGNALRLALTGQLAGDVGALPRWDDPDTIQTLSLCLSCKACKSECPSNVDMARLKAEYTAQRYRTQGRIPLAAWLVGNVRRLNQLGALVPSLANWANALPPMRWALGRLMNVHPRRPLPQFSKALERRAAEFGAPTPAGASPPRVAIFGDCFTSYNESDIGVALGRVLARLGYQPEVAAAGCCGRSMISVGMLEQAIDTIDATLARLRPLIEDDAVAAIIVAEPSCLSAIRDDWLQLRCRSPLDLRQRLARKAMLPEEFIDQFWASHPNQTLLQEAVARASAAPEPVLLHAHCHQKALWGAESSAKALRRFFGPRLKVLDTGCCGMAGSFGYDADKFDLSMAIANLPAEMGGLLPQLAASPAALVAAPGTSCRHQIKDATAGARRALHPIELIDQALA